MNDREALTLSNEKDTRQRHSTDRCILTPESHSALAPWQSLGAGETSNLQSGSSHNILLDQSGHLGLPGVAPMPQPIPPIQNIGITQYQPQTAMVDIEVQEISTESYKVNISFCS